LVTQVGPQSIATAFHMVNMSWYASFSIHRVLFWFSGFKNISLNVIMAVFCPYMPSTSLSLYKKYGLSWWAT